MWFILRVKRCRKRRVLYRDDSITIAKQVFSHPEQHLLILPLSVKWSGWRQPSDYGQPRETRWPGLHLHQPSYCLKDKVSSDRWRPIHVARARDCGSVCYARMFTCTHHGPREDHANVSHDNSSTSTRRGQNIDSITALPFWSLLQKQHRRTTERFGPKSQKAYANHEP